MITVQKLIDLLETVDNKDLPVFVGMGRTCLALEAFVASEDDAVELWAR